MKDCYVPQATKRVWNRGASSRPIKSARFLIKFWFTGTYAMEMLRWGSKRECESFAQVYSKQMFTEDGATPCRITVEAF